MMLSACCGPVAAVAAGSFIAAPRYGPTSSLSRREIRPLRANHPGVPRCHVVQVLRIPIKLNISYPGGVAAAATSSQRAEMKQATPRRGCKAPFVDVPRTHTYDKGTCQLAGDGMPKSCRSRAEVVPIRRSRRHADMIMIGRSGYVRRPFSRVAFYRVARSDGPAGYTRRAKAWTPTRCRRVATGGNEDAINNLPICLKCNSRGTTPARQLSLHPPPEDALLRRCVPGGALEPRDEPAQGALPPRRGGI